MWHNILFSELGVKVREKPGCFKRERGRERGKEKGGGGSESERKKEKEKEESEREREGVWNKHHKNLECPNLFCRLCLINMSTLL